MDNSKEITLLNKLISRNYDAEKGYKEAAQRAENSALKSFFTDQVKERYDFGHDIKPMIIVDGGEVQKGTSILGDLHREIMKIKDMVTDADDEAIVEECLRGEEFSKTDYQTAIESAEVDAKNKKVLETHLKAINKAITKLTDLKAILG